MSWITLLKYLEWDNEFYMLVLTIRHSVVRVGKFCLMVLPAFGDIPCCVSLAGAM